MTNIIDTVVLAFLGFHLARGIIRGFLRTLIGPLSLILGTIFAFFFYLETQDLIKAILISVLTPLLVSILLNILLNFFESSRSKDESHSSLSRFGGGFISLIWSCVWVTLLMVLFSIIPVEKGWFKKFQELTFQSGTYNIVERFLENRVPLNTVNAQKITTIFEDPQQYQTLQGTPEYQELYEDETVQALFSDPKVMEQINNNDIAGLLANPKFQLLLQDKDLIQKFFALHGKMMALDPEPSAPGTP